MDQEELRKLANSIPSPEREEERIAEIFNFGEKATRIIEEEGSISVAMDSEMKIGLQQIRTRLVLELVHDVVGHVSQGDAPWTLSAVTSPDHAGDTVAAAECSRRPDGRSLQPKQ